MWVPNSVFDDRLLCMQWQNKNQDNAQVDIDNLIENEIKEKTLSAPKQYNTENTVQIKEMSTDNPIKLYPNPANTQVNIRYKNANDTKLQIVNILGIVITEIDLPKDIHYELLKGFLPKRYIKLDYIKKKSENKDNSIVSKYFEFGSRDLKLANKILSEDDVDIIKKKYGGLEK